MFPSMDSWLTASTVVRQLPHHPWLSDSAYDKAGTTEVTSLK